jgi:hypothetical protein
MIDMCMINVGSMGRRGVNRALRCDVGNQIYRYPLVL